MKRVPFAAFWIGLAVECIYVVFSRLILHAEWSHLMQPLVFIFLFGLLGVTQGKVRWIASLLRCVIGILFVLSVADRFGLLGPPGKSVSWGNFSHFVAYTHQVNSFLPASLAPLLAVLAPICETAFGITLILAVYIQHVAGAPAVL